MKEEISTIQHECTREGCKYYDDNSYKVFFKCKAKTAFDLSANSLTTQYANCIKALEEIKTICNEYPNIKDKGDYQEIIGDTPVAKVYKIKIIVNEVLK